MAVSNDWSARRVRLQQEIFTGQAELRVGADLSSEELLSLVSDWFRRPDRSISALSREDLARVLRDLTKPAGIGLWEAVADATVSIESRLTAIEASQNLYAEVFERLCEPHLVHLSETSDSLNVCCFLWWEDFPGSTMLPEAERGRLRTTAIQVMLQCWRKSQNVACRESVIHGLGDWTAEWGAAGSTVLQQFADEDRSPLLRDYANRLLNLARRTGPAPKLH